MTAFALLVGGSVAVCFQVYSNAFARRDGLLGMLTLARASPVMLMQYPSVAATLLAHPAVVQPLAEDGVINTGRYLTHRYGCTLKCIGLVDAPLGLNKRLLRRQGDDAFMVSALIGHDRRKVLVPQIQASTETDVSGEVVATIPTNTRSVLATDPLQVNDLTHGFVEMLPKFASQSELPEKVQPHRATHIPGRGVETLPLVEYYAPGSDRLAIMISGDGGWRQLDQGLAKELQHRGISVVGWSSLSYFWNLRTPEQVGDDLGRVIAYYQHHWDAHQLILIGYSFGSDVMPFAYARLTPAQRNQVDFISLLALGHQADFKGRIFGWIGWGEHGTRDVLPALAAFDLQRVQCIYGQYEKDTLCPELRGRVFDVVMRPGGHHFDNDPAKLANAILQGWRRSVETREPHRAES
ncbi:virulence factor [Xylella taiwanensis]|uniref:Virulence factor n=1 Tax=Xylella taiwanensis TaxID=1444770 RepID=A0ABS8TW11_9GAMM|nr:virulence factor [Xylella taiwanensis]MCD8472757.1 virulence factor [Xylella taiwanensis]UFN03559.1 virulence factor [Xylella taiwanensis]